MKLEAMPRTRAAFAEWRSAADEAGLAGGMVGYDAKSGCTRFVIGTGRDRFEFLQGRLDPVPFDLPHPTSEQRRAVDVLAELGVVRVTDWRG